MSERRTVRAAPPWRAVRAASVPVNRSAAPSAAGPRRPDRRALTARAAQRGVAAHRLRAARRAPGPRPRSGSPPSWSSKPPGAANLLASERRTRSGGGDPGTDAHAATPQHETEHGQPEHDHGRTVPPASASGGYSFREEAPRHRAAARRPRRAAIRDRHRTNGGTNGSALITVTGRGRPPRVAPAGRRAARRAPIDLRLVPGPTQDRFRRSSAGARTLVTARRGAPRES